MLRSGRPSRGRHCWHQQPPLVSSEQPTRRPGGTVVMMDPQAVNHLGYLKIGTYPISPSPNKNHHFQYGNLCFRSVQRVTPQLRTPLSSGHLSHARRECSCHLESSLQGALRGTISTCHMMPHGSLVVQQSGKIFVIVPNHQSTFEDGCLPHVLIPTSYGHVTTGLRILL